MKRGIIALLLALLLLPLSACGQTAEHPMIQWEQTANLTAQETPEELYVAALEEGTLVVCSTSTRMMDVAKSFERQYPGLTVRVEDIREHEMYELIQQNFDDGTYTIDLICSADGRGIMTSEFLDQGVAYKYIPWDIEPALVPGSNGALLKMSQEAIVLCYNDAYYDAQPVSNWWELTEEQWRGKVYVANPIRSATMFAFLTAIIQNGDQMAVAYVERYGVEPTLAPGENAGHTFIRALMENDVMIVNSGDEVCEAVAAPGSHSPSLGTVATTKLRLRTIGYPLAAADGMTPIDGNVAPIYIMLAGGAKNLNAAKLFIRWVCGEADGQGEGYKPYLQSGAWSQRIDVAAESVVSMDALELWDTDRTYLYAHKDDILIFWKSLVQARQ